MKAGAAAQPIYKGKDGTVPPVESGKSVVLWISKNKNDDKLIEIAKKANTNIEFFVLRSPQEIATFMRKNASELKRYESDGGRLRVLTNNSQDSDSTNRFEKSLYVTNGAFMIIGKLRNYYGINCPVLVYCGRPHTVKMLISESKMVNITVSHRDVTSFISFIQGINDFKVPL